MAVQHSNASEPRVLAVDDVAGERIETPGFQRTIKTLLQTGQMTAHVGIFDPGQSGSHHVHAQSQEVTYVVEGVGEVAVGDQVLPIKAGDMFYGPANLPHQFRNTGTERLVCFAIYSPPDDIAALIDRELAQVNQAQGGA